MKMFILIFLMIIANVAMASEEIFVGSLELTEPTIFELHKTHAGQIEIYVEAFVDWGDEHKKESESVMKVIPQLELGEDRAILYNGIMVGKVNGMIRGDYMIKSLMDIVSEKEIYCSIYYKEVDCVKTALRYNVFLILH